MTDKPTTFVPIFASPLPKREVELMNVLVLAFVGDSVHTMAVRARLASTDGHKSGELHHMAIKEISARAQAVTIERILPLLTEEELQIYRRARNSKPKSLAKNAEPEEYHKATGFEAVLGYLYLSGQTQRLSTLLEESL